MNERSLNPGQGRTAPTLICSFVERIDVAYWSLDECVSAPSRFQIFFDDPMGQRYVDFAESIGEEVEISFGTGPAFKGKVWGRRLNNDPVHGGTVCELYGYDNSFALKTGHRLRSFAEATFEEIAEQIIAPTQMSVRMPEPPAGRLGETTQLVQYWESDFAFLYRLAYQSGFHLWPYRGEFWLGSGPGAEVSCTIDATPNANHPYEVVAKELHDGHDLVPPGYVFPTIPSFFPDAEKAKNGDSLQVAPDTDTPAHVLSPDQYQQMPTALALTESDVEPMASASSSRAQRERVQGMFVLAGEPPEDLMLGSPTAIGLHGKALADGAIATRIRHEFVGASQRTIVSLGRQSNLLATIPDLLPAKHLWPAQIKGDYDPKLGVQMIQFAGWDSESQPINARLRAISAKTGRGIISKYDMDEWVIVGFEQGNPDAPIVIGSILAEPQEDLDSKSSSLLAAVANGKPVDFNLTEGGQLEINHEDGNFLVQLDFAEKKINLKTGETQLQLAESKVGLSSNGEMEIKATKIDMKE
ncbi:MAG TPA: hypothetical protein DDW52_28050 [Planctomycetaceae bacterium]|nr:hypothetical protein [Planctomycetaceae bacterium]